MEKRLLPFGALLATGFLFGLPAGAQAACNGQTQIEMNSCASADYAEADKALNQIYGDLVKQLSATPQEVENLRKAQRLWIQFRDADCRFAGQSVRGGSMEPMVVTLCLAERSRERSVHLATALQEAKSL